MLVIVSAKVQKNLITPTLFTIFFTFLHNKRADASRTRPFLQ